MTEKEPLLSYKAVKFHSISNGIDKNSVQYRHNENVSWWTRSKRKSGVKTYYIRLAELQDLYEHDINIITGEKKPDSDERAPDRYLARAATILNVILLFVNLTASIMSGSLAIISTFIDSMMDITTSVILGVCLYLINRTNKFKYPRGRARLELVGVILCSVIMGIANMGVIMQSVTTILAGNVQPEVDALTLAIMLGGSLVKLGLMILCYRRGSTSCKVLAMDMRNDIATTLVAVTSAFIGSKYWVYADPVGAISVCGIIAICWFHNALEHVPILVGVRAEREHLSRILKIAIEHDERIKYIDHVMVYHTGLEAIVELHIVMDENLPLKITHDISHPLEKKLLKLDFVERAFVHCDYDCDGD